MKLKLLMVNEVSGFVRVRCSIEKHSVLNSSIKKCQTALDPRSTADAGSLWIF